MHFWIWICVSTRCMCALTKKKSLKVFNEREKKATKIMMATFGVDVNRCCQLMFVIRNIDFSKRWRKVFHKIFRQFFRWHVGSLLHKEIIAWSARFLRIFTFFYFSVSCTRRVQTKSKFDPLTRACVGRFPSFFLKISSTLVAIFIGGKVIVAGTTNDIYA